MYITKANFKQIVFEFETPNTIKFEDLVIWTLPNGAKVMGDLESSKKHAFSAMFSQKERNQLLLFKALCKGETYIIDHLYKKIEKPIDSMKYVQAEKQPVYHSDPNCPAMMSDYERVSIPEQVIAQGKDKIMIFRNFWVMHSELREKDMPTFIKELNKVINPQPPIKISDIEKTIFPNSGSKKIKDNRSVSEINDEINRIWTEFVIWLKEDRKRLNICINCGYLSWKGNSSEPLEPKLIDRFRCSEKELKEYLMLIDSYKLKIKEQLLELYMRTYIPDLNFDDKLLESLGFIPCRICNAKGLGGFL